MFTIYWFDYTGCPVMYRIRFKLAHTDVLGIHPKIGDIKEIEKVQKEQQNP